MDDMELNNTDKNDLVINIEHASVFFDGRWILDDVNWSLKKGDRCFILGANGAGKTTLVKILMGYLWPRYGAVVEVLGSRYGRTNLLELRKSLAWVSPAIHQLANCPRLTAGEMVVSGVDSTIGIYRDIPENLIAQAHELLGTLNADHLFCQKYHTLSSGEQVKVLIARALMTSPKLLILDEPNVYLDISGREFMLKTIEELAEKWPDMTIIFITQRIEDILPLFDCGMILKQGRILASGERSDVLTESNLRNAFDCNIRLIKTAGQRLWAVIE